MNDMNKKQTIKYNISSFSTRTTIIVSTRVPLYEYSCTSLMVLEYSPNGTAVFARHKSSSAKQVKESG